MVWYGGSEGGATNPGAPNAIEGGWVVDSNDTNWFLVIDEQTGDATYYDQPGGTPGTPVGTVAPVTGEPADVSGLATEATAGSIDANADRAADAAESLDTKADALAKEATLASRASEATLGSANSKLGNIETELSDFAAKTAAGLVPEEFDELNISYVTSGNGVGEIYEVEYRNNGGLVITLRMTYDANDKLSNVSRVMPV